MREAALHACQIARVDARGIQLHQHLAGFDRWRRPLADLEITDGAMFLDVNCLHAATGFLLASAKTGSAASCKAIENAIRAASDRSYNKPMIALPTNQNTPKPVSKTPKAVLRFPEEITGARTAFRQESCAPIPIPQRTIPSSSVLVPPKNTNGAKNAGTPKATIKMGKPTRSNSLPKSKALRAP